MRRRHSLAVSTIWLWRQKACVFFEILRKTRYSFLFAGTGILHQCIVVTVVLYRYRHGQPYAWPTVNGRSHGRCHGCAEFTRCHTCSLATHEDERTILYKTKSLDGTKPNTNPKTKTKTNPNPNTNPNPKLTQILTVFSCLCFFRVPSPYFQFSHSLKCTRFYTKCCLIFLYGADRRDRFGYVYAYGLELWMLVKLKV